MRARLYLVSLNAIAVWLQCTLGVSDCTCQRGLGPCSALSAQAVLTLFMPYVAA